MDHGAHLGFVVENVQQRLHVGGGAARAFHGVSVPVHQHDVLGLHGLIGHGGGGDEKISAGHPQGHVSARQRDQPVLEHGQGGLDHGVAFSFIFHVKNLLSREMP